MLYSTIDTAAPALAAFLQSTGKPSAHVLIITHVNPDGDAIGSTVGLGLALELLGHRATMLAPTTPPPFLRNMPALERVRDYAADAELPPDIDLVMLVDTGDVRRIGRVWEDHEAFLLARPIAVIDHHVTNTGEGAVNYVDPSRSSTCELVYDVLRAWHLEPTPAIATALLFGIITDTQSFRTSNTTASALRVAADLLEYGGDREQIVRDVYNAVPATTAKLLGHALDVMQYDDEIAWTHVSNVMQDATGADDDAYSEVTDYLSALGGFRAIALFKERRDGTVKVSMRSIPGVDVSAVARVFGGGGHKQAAGCTIVAPLREAETQLLKALRAQLAATPRP
jgi:bifunctional oligoribonuclease and PAP phosphatase NrnA